MEEHRDVIKAAVEFTNHRIPVVAGTGSNCTKTAIQLTKEAEESGADGALVVTPYYNKATQKGLVEHYTMIARETKLPIILYNVPGRTGVNIQPDTVAEIVKRNPNIVGIKDAVGNVSAVYDSEQFVVDIIAPTGSISTAAFTNSLSIDITVNASDSTSGIS